MYCGEFTKHTKNTQKIITIQELTTTMISKLMHFPLLFSFLPCIATILHAALFTWHCNVSPTHVIKILYRLWFNAVITRHVRQQKSISKHRKNKPPRKKKTGKERRLGKGSTQLRSWKAESGRWQRFPRAGGCNREAACQGRWRQKQGHLLWQARQYRQGLYTRQGSPSMQRG